MEAVNKEKLLTCGPVCEKRLHEELFMAHSSVGLTVWLRWEVAMSPPCRGAGSTAGAGRLHGRLRGGTRWREEGSSIAGAVVEVAGQGLLRRLCARGGSDMARSQAGRGQAACGLKREGGTCPAAPTASARRGAKCCRAVPPSSSSAPGGTAQTLPAEPCGHGTGLPHGTSPASAWTSPTGEGRRPTALLGTSPALGLWGFLPAARRH